ncbi:integrin-linked protein kinase family [Artemisia annua]|uniref:Integrin-linked protein kinase family n=1 Tax=Artemisia annua TaxID=35608 RepID=A0A2U1NBH6_ARTAN|nr:integrin-linked protein kinase family [Artemisia annua]
MADLIQKELLSFGSPEEVLLVTSVTCLLLVIVIKVIFVYFKEDRSNKANSSSKVCHGYSKILSLGIYDVFGNSSEVCFCTILKVSKRVKQGRNMSYHDTTWTYVAPEVFRSEDYDNTVDGFSFALILQEELELCNKEWECIVASQGGNLLL